MRILDCRGLVGLMRAAHRNHVVLANNLANLETPGYRTSRVKFDRRLEDVLDHYGHLRPDRTIETKTYQPGYPESGPDGNNVKLEREIVELNKNSVRMQLYLDVLHSRIRRLRDAIAGR